jgi:anti-sigma factor RsiW
MKCQDLETLLCDYVDGALTPQEKATVELHLAHCPECRELAADASAAVVFMERAAPVEPPPALVNGILFELRNGKAPVKKAGAFGWLGKLLEPVLQPKFAMGMVMTILSFSMLGRFAGIPSRQLKPQDLEPARIYQALEDKAARAWERAVKYYESLRLVYEVQQTLKDWKGEEEAAQPAAPAPPPAEGPIQTNSSQGKGAPGAEGRQTK